MLAEIAARVYTIERLPVLADGAARTLRSLGYDRVEVRCGDGTLGWPEHAPFEAISVTAAGPELPHALLEQRAVGGRLVMPVGSPSGGLFVPLVGADGWPEQPAATGGPP